MKQLFTGLLVAAGLLAQDEIRLVAVAQGLDGVVDIQNARDGSRRLFLVEQAGTIRVLDNGQLSPFLDISDRTRARNECGLLGLAFPPRFAEKRYFYVNYTNPACNQTVVSRIRLDANGMGDAASEHMILTERQPFTNHNGGQLQFGPDGYLYVGLGDGGSAGDPNNAGQDRRNRLGKILRIDTESGAAGFTVPESNPFVGDASALPEIWAWGLRNPWRFSFDRETGDMWIGDVGQNRAEEINFQPASSSGGENYGWRTMEGFECFNPRNGCDRTGLTLPVHEYTRERGDVSVTGGHVYRGTRPPSLVGTYIYADYATGRIWGLRQQGDRFVNRLLRESQFSISTFGEDEDGEIYVSAFNQGVVHRIEAMESGPAPRLTSNAVVNAASFQPGVVAGSLVTLFPTGVTSGPGIVTAPALPLPGALSGVRVTMNGLVAPMLAVANAGGQEQLNVQAPVELTGSQAAVIVERFGTASEPVSVPLLALQPAIFGRGGEALVVRAAGNSIASAENPLRRDEFAYFYATGLGAVDNPPRTGAGAPADPVSRARAVVTVTLDGVPCEVQFAGLAPGFAGVYQVNIRIPAAVTAGRKELVVSAGSVRSPGLPVSVQ